MLISGSVGFSSLLLNTVAHSELGYRLKGLSTVLVLRLPICLMRYVAGAMTIDYLEDADKVPIYTLLPT